MTSSTGRVAGKKAFITGAADRFVSVVGDLITIATGGPDGAVQNRWIIELRDGLISAGTAAKDLFDNVLVPAFQTIRQYAQPVAEQINRIFGTNLSGDQLLIVAAVTQLAGGFRLLFSVLGLGVNSLRLVFDVLGLIAPLGKVITGIWPVRPKSLGDATMPSPKCHCHNRFTATRANSGFSFAVSQPRKACRRSPSNFRSFGANGNPG